MTTPPDHTAHPRSERARRAILAAAADLLEESGFRAMTIDAVVARAHASKATLYRHWPTKAALAMDALMAEIDPASPFPDTGSVVQDIRQSVHATVALFTRPRIRQILLGVLVQLPGDHELRAAYRERYVEPRRRQGELALRRGIERGELRPDLDAEVLFDEIYGAIYFRLLIAGAGLDRTFVDGLISHTFSGALARGEGARP
jgi:AcrR family transcriptional regulator